MLVLDVLFENVAENMSLNHSLSKCFSSDIHLWVWCSFAMSWGRGNLQRIPNRSGARGGVIGGRT